MSRALRKPKKEEQQRRRWKEQRAAENREAKQLLTFRHRVLAEVVKRIKASLGTEALRFLTRFVLASLSHDLAARLAKRRGLHNPKSPHGWQAIERVHMLYKRLDADELVPLLFEAMLLSSLGSAVPDRHRDPLMTGAALAKVNVRAIRLALAKEVRAKAQKSKTKKKEPK